MGRQNRHAMPWRVCHCVVSATIHSRVVDRHRTLIRQTGGARADAARRLKILVSVVRFRPGPPRTCIAKRPLIEVGVFVSGNAVLASGLSPVTFGPQRLRPKRPDFNVQYRRVRRAASRQQTSHSPNDNNRKPIMLIAIFLLRYMLPSRIALQSIRRRWIQM